MPRLFMGGRWVTVDPRTAQALEEYIRVRPAYKGPPVPPDEEPLFLNEDGTAMTEADMVKTMDRLTGGVSPSGQYSPKTARRYEQWLAGDDSAQMFIRCKRCGGQQPLFNEYTPFAEDTQICVLCHSERADESMRDEQHR